MWQDGPSTSGPSHLFLLSSGADGRGDCGAALSHHVVVWVLQHSDTLSAGSGV